MSACLTGIASPRLILCAAPTVVFLNANLLWLILYLAIPKACQIKLLAGHLLLVLANARPVFASSLTSCLCPDPLQVSHAVCSHFSMPVLPASCTCQLFLLFTRPIPLTLRNSPHSSVGCPLLLLQETFAMSCLPYRDGCPFLCTFFLPHCISVI